MSQDRARCNTANSAQDPDHALDWLISCRARSTKRSPLLALFEADGGLCFRLPEISKSGLASSAERASRPDREHRLLSPGKSAELSVTCKCRYGARALHRHGGCRMEKSSAWNVVTARTPAVTMHQ